MQPPFAKRLQIFLPFAWGYFLSYLFRVVNAVLVPQLVADVGVTASDLGLLTSAYFITFACCQLPLGILLDRFGPRRVEATLLIVATLGAWIFSRAHNLAMLIIGRGLIGIGVSACLMASFKAYVVWFPKRQLPTINGFQVAAGGLGALVATAPVHALLNVTDWRGIFGGLAVASALAAALIYAMVPRDPPPDVRLSWKTQLGGLGRVAGSLAFWRIAPLSTVNQAVFLAVHGLWLGPYLRDMAGLDASGVAHTLSLTAMGMVAGYIVLGILAEKVGRYGFSPMTVAATGMGVFNLFLASLILDRPAVHPLFWVLFGFFGTSGIPSYAALSQRFDAVLAGRVNTALNLLVFIVAFSAQWGIGAIIDLWPHAVTGGYAPEGYQASIALLVGLQVVAMAWFAIAGRLESESEPIKAGAV